MNRRGADALLIAALGMATGALAAAVSAIGLTSMVDVAYRILVAVGLMGASTSACWVWVELKGCGGATGAPVPAPVRVRARAKQQ